MLVKTIWIQCKSNLKVLVEVNESRKFIKVVEKLIGHLLTHKEFVTDNIQGEVREDEEGQGKHTSEEDHCICLCDMKGAALDMSESL